MADLWIPGWEIRRFTTQKSTVANANRVCCGHTQVGSYEGSWAWGNRAGNSYAHGYIPGDGRGILAQPINLRAAANLEGNPYVTAFETEDVNPRYFPAWSLRCGDVPAWTDPQLDRMAQGMAWWCVRFGRPPELIPDARPGRVGLAYHRQGVPISPEWVTGADRWTSSVGKCCPDWRRIHQFVNEVVPEVARRVSGIPTPTPGGFLMALTDKQQDELYEWARRAAHAVTPFYQDELEKAGKLDGRFMVGTLINRAIADEMTELRNLLAQARLELIVAAGVNGALQVPTGTNALDTLVNAVVDRIPTGGGTGAVDPATLRAAAKAGLTEALREGVG